MIQVISNHFLRRPAIDDIELTSCDVLGDDGGFHSLLQHDVILGCMPVDELAPSHLDPSGATLSR